MVFFEILGCVERRHLVLFAITPFVPIVFLIKFESIASVASWVPVIGVNGIYCLLETLMLATFLFHSFTGEVEGV